MSIMSLMIGLSTDLYVTAAPDPNDGIDTVSPVYTSQQCVCTPQGGQPGYNYLWSRTSGDATMVIDSPATAATYIHAAMGVGFTKSAAFKCTVTDAGGTVRDSNEINVTLGRFP